MSGKSGWAIGLGLAAVILAGAVVWAGWIGRGPIGTPERRAASKPGHVEVKLYNLRFDPARLEIAAGTVVTFINRDPVTHDIVQTTPSQLGRERAAFASPRLGPGDSWTYRFDDPGRYPILCLDGGHYAVGMLGVIEVLPAGH